ncbi:MAG TPA: sigma-70 family RNA polymerase sigma factor [Solirubrobacteraceae bacterium]|jgi:RNA polymerase sigma-70 factor (ECF subfamily)|nr:sigma-70 family RNA polymerase sigma factor [Solirubrobacteraceae bacterium]
MDEGEQQVTSPRNPRPRPHSRSPDANDLLVRAASGDQDAFCALYDLLANVIFHRCLAIVRDIAHAEDALQDTFFELWRTAPRYDPALGSARNWALKIAHHRSVDKVRRIQSMTESDIRDAARQGVRPFDEVAEEIILRAEREQIRELLGDLTERQRLVIDLVYYRGHSLAETAALLDMPLGTVKTRVRDAMIRLRSAMSASLEDARANP